MTDASFHSQAGESDRVLARERTDLPEAVRSLAGPPVPSLEPPYGLRVAQCVDAEMVSEWMNRPHLAEAWEYDWPPSRWQRHLSAQLKGAYSLPLIGSMRGTDRAYLELYWAAKDLISRHYDADPYDLGLHAAIADVSLVNRGLGPLLLPRIMASAFSVEPRCRQIMFDPDHRNSAARRLCEYVGCRFLGEHDTTNRRMALYALERPTTSALPS
jgi:RimJ/RimL family protein N-acetyltransferase